jgi:hypothetical protein
MGSFGRTFLRESHSAGRKRKPFTKACSSGKRICCTQTVFSVNYATGPRPVACTVSGYVVVYSPRPCRLVSRRGIGLRNAGVG